MGSFKWVSRAQSDLQSEKEWLDNLAPEQASRGSRRSHSLDKGISNEGLGVVRSGVGSGVEEYLPNHSGESQNRDNSIGSSGMGANDQSLVELHIGCAFNFLGGVRSLDQAKKAIGGALLRRIRMVDSGKEVSGPEGYGYGTNGEQPNADTNSDSHFGGEVRCVDKLQGRCGRDTEVYDDMEIGVEALEGLVEKAGMEYSGSCNYES
nr:hypothetical protein CFP56_17633 [Quercus suber]